MTNVGRAHGASLPLFSILQAAEGKPTCEACDHVHRGVAALNLEKDVNVVIMIGRGTHLAVEGVTEYGDLVVRELMARMEFPPCPEGTCEYDGQGACKWCGTIPRQ